MLEAIVQHQLEHSTIWTTVPDFNLIFMALTLAKRSKFGVDGQSYCEHRRTISHGREQVGLRRL